MQLIRQILMEEFFLLRYAFNIAPYFKSFGRMMLWVADSVA